MPWGKPNSWLGESPAGLAEASPLSAQNWGSSEQLERNLRSMSMENVYLISNFKSAFPGAGGGLYSSLESW